MLIKKPFYILIIILYLCVPVTAAADTHTHQFKDELIEPTCYSEGSYRRVCSVCGEQEGETTVLPKKSHTFGKWNTNLPPKCFSAGRDVRVCTICGEREYREVPANNKHKPVRQYNIPATEYSSGETTVICRDCNTMLSKKIYPRIAEISFPKRRYPRRGTVIKPEPAVVDSEGNIISSENYRLMYEKKPKAVGTHYVTIRFKKHYRGSYKLSYDIVPEKPKSFSVKTSGGNAVLKYKKCGGVQVKCSDNIKFKNCKKLSFNGKKSKLSVTALNRNKTYYFKIREYKSVNGKVYYSAWSKAKRVRT